ncbi:MAG: hypothetical protein HRF50_04115 [Phycisphaerae bacterium]|jgi:hypothetical protein
MTSRRLTVATWSWLWRACTWLASRRRAVASESQVRRHVFRDQAARMGLGMTELLRDRYRPRWLRRVTPVEGPDAAGPDDPPR